MTACLAGCIAAALLGLLMLVKFEASFFALLSIAIFPAFACWMSGLTDSKQLCKIAAYASTGWMLAYMLQPVVSQSSLSRAARIAKLPLLGHEWHIFACFISTLLALTGAFFVPVGDILEKSNKAQLHKTPDESAV